MASSSNPAIISLSLPRKCSSSWRCRSRYITIQGDNRYHAAAEQKKLLLADIVKHKTSSSRASS
jgi:hypothetical protein